MSWVAVAVAGVGVLNAAVSSKAAKDASSAQSGASAESIAEQRRQYDLSRADLAPYREAGAAAIPRMRDLLGIGSGEFTPEQIMQSDPGYQFRLDQGNKAIENAARARGMYYSPATVKELLRYGQDYSSGEYGNIYNRLAGISGTGQTATTTGAGLGANYAGNVGNLLTGAANARGAAGIGAANAWGNAFSNIGNYFAQQQSLNKILGSGGYNMPNTYSGGGSSGYTPTPYAYGGT
jgi:hypothetical protein